MTLSEGDEPPRVEAPNQDAERTPLDYDAPTVVYFYPRDETPGCTTEARSFEKEAEEYETAGVRVYGVSTDTVDSHCDFAEEHGLSFDLLADTDGEVADAFGVSVENGYADRTTFVVVDGVVHSVYENVSPEGHGRDVLIDLVDDGVVSLS
ncbi:peroxiredoxin [Haladaptatus sp. F3-133]|jgi:peroxiredoxin Q/BCP|uniref:thioredoxin-dependent peroxiredoxin n=1 Tax=Halorutilus salinus TaxID=2487751 RepID=A0A9Q4C5S1_9EURY|nr:peroxiredoxin [Halorutilus salinus]MCX2819978.1 peroxiredoxin [Halorutilus salinus]